MIRPVRTEHYTSHLIAPAHTIIVRRVGGFELWTVDEHVGHTIRDLTVTDKGGSCWYTQRHEAETLAEAYVAIRTHHPVGEGAR